MMKIGEHWIFIRNWTTNVVLGVNSIWNGMTLMWGCRQGRVRPGPSGRGWQSNEVLVIPSQAWEDHNQNPEYFKVRARSLLSFKLAKLSGFESQLEEVSVSMFSGENFNQFPGCKVGCQCLQVKITLSRSRDRKSHSHTPPVSGVDVWKGLQEG